MLELLILIFIDGFALLVLFHSMYSKFLQVEEVEMEIQKYVEERERKRREMENRIDSQLKNWPLLYLEQIVCSK